MTAEVGSRFDPLLLGGFFDARTCEEIIAEMRSAESDAATVHGIGASSSVEQMMRRATRVTPSVETVALVRRRLLECKERIGKHFQINLSDCEEPQFLRYQVGDFFVAHQDGNTPLIRSDKVRIVSAIIFLSQQSESPAAGAYCGGSLVFSGHHVDPNLRETRSIRGETGTLVTFRAETTHEVTPVTHGERHSIACWYR